ncbi:MAG: enoyl-CoA hydratase/isomerase family protein, partial [Deltaproteobacteria bacterium]
MSKPPIVTERRDDGVVVLRLDRPDQRNALDREMFEA